MRLVETAAGVARADDITGRRRNLFNSLCSMPEDGSLLSSRSTHPITRRHLTYWEVTTTGSCKGSSQSAWNSQVQTVYIHPITNSAISI
jgi:hypothetical protein